MFCRARRGEKLAHRHFENKICDHFRKASRETSFTHLQFYDDEESDRFVNEGLGKGGWIHELGPQEWPKAGEALDNDLFLKTYRDCSGKLPKNVAAVFNLRVAEHFRRQPVGDAASGAHGAAPLPRNELVLKAGVKPPKNL